MPSLLDEYRSEAHRVEEDALVSSKGHYAAAARWAVVHWWIGIPNAMLAGAAGVIALGGDASSELALSAAGYLALSATLAATVVAFMKPGERSAQHTRCAGEYLALRNQSRMFVNIHSALELPPDELRMRFETLARCRDTLNSTSPQVPEWAFEKAKQGIKQGEASYEIN